MTAQSTTGWTIAQWKDFTTTAAPEKVLDTLHQLVFSLAKDDPAWIAISSPELIASQWGALQKQGPQAAKVCYPLENSAL